jgi:H+-transporting ATPase
VIATLCGISETSSDDPRSTAYFGKVSELASHGTRALGVARSDDGGKTWDLLGLLALLDPPRPDAKETIAQARALGLSVKMVTGDDVAIGSEISRQLGLGTHLLVADQVFLKIRTTTIFRLMRPVQLRRPTGLGVYSRRTNTRSLKRCKSVITLLQ